MTHLTGKKVAILVEEGFEQIELTSPKEALEKAGASTVIVSPKSGKVKGWSRTDWGDEFAVDVPLDKANARDFDALVLPGGVMNPDKLRQNEKAMTFVRAFHDAGKPIAAICHAPWVLIDAGIADQRTLTSYPSLRLDLENAGATWVDREVVVDNGLVTSRNVDDLPAFNRKMLEEIEEGIHQSDTAPAH